MSLTDSHSVRVCDKECGNAAMGLVWLDSRGSCHEMTVSCVFLDVFSCFVLANHPYCRRELKRSASKHQHSIEECLLLTAAAAALKTASSLAPAVILHLSDIRFRSIDHRDGPRLDRRSRRPLGTIAPSALQSSVQSHSSCPLLSLH